MMHDPAYIKELFSRFMAGQCSREEIDVLITYLETADDDQLLPSVAEFRDAFPELRQIGEAASGRIQDKLKAIANEGGLADKSAEPGHAGQGPQTETVRRLGRYRRLQTGRIRRAAAILAFIAVSAVAYWSYQFFTPERYDTGSAQIRSLRLDDGSQVTLNANSDLEVRFSADVREVWLNGEAFFRVAHDSAKKFIVHTSDRLSIEVLGTEFNVKDRTGATSVVLNKGSIRLKLRNGAAPAGQLLMSPGEMAEYRPADDSLFKIPVDTMRYSSWKDNLLIFDETSLKQVALTIENQFGYTVRFASEELENLRFTGSNPANDLDMLLETLERSFGLTIQKNGNELIISKFIES